MARLPESHASPKCAPGRRAVAQACSTARPLDFSWISTVPLGSAALLAGFPLPPPPPNHLSIPEASGPVHSPCRCLSLFSAQSSTSSLLHACSWTPHPIECTTYFRTSYALLLSSPRSPKQSFLLRHPGLVLRKQLVHTNVWLTNGQRSTPITLLTCRLSRLPSSVFNFMHHTNFRTVSLSVCNFPFDFSQPATHSFSEFGDVAS
jgi:hypothetical protein